MILKKNIIIKQTFFLSLVNLDKTGVVKLETYLKSHLKKIVGKAKDAKPSTKRKVGRKNAHGETGQKVTFLIKRFKN